MKYVNRTLLVFTTLHNMESYQK